LPEALKKSQGGVPSSSTLVSPQQQQPLFKFNVPISVLHSQLYETVVSTLRRDGNCLLPVDASGRVLELALILNRHWLLHNLAETYHLVWYAPLVTNTIEYARSQLEYMTSELTHEFDTGLSLSSSENPATKRKGGRRSKQQQNHPLALSAFTLVSSLAELESFFPGLTRTTASYRKRGVDGAVEDEDDGAAKDGVEATRDLDGGLSEPIDATGGKVGDAGGAGKSEKMGGTTNKPTCILASGLSLETGPARDLFLAFYDNPDNAIVLTDSSQSYLRPVGRQRRQKKNQESQRTELTPMQTDRGKEEKVQSPFVTEDHSEMPAIVESDTSNDISQRSAIDNKIISSASGPDAIVNAEEGESDELGLPLPGVPIRDLASMSPWSAAAQLFKAWYEAKLKKEEMSDSVTVDVMVPYRVPLAGAELQAFLADEEESRRKERLEEEQRAILREVEIAKDRLRLGEDDGITGSTKTSTSTMSTAAVAAPSNSARPRKKSRFDAGLFLKFSKPQYRKCMRPKVTTIV
jgi:Beta-Casp domain